MSIVNEYRITRNRAKCLRCGDIVESKTVHELRTCWCGSLSVDGGREYLRRLGDPLLRIELSEYAEDVTGEAV